MSDWGRCLHGRVGFCAKCGNMPEESIHDLRTRAEAAEREKDEWRGKYKAAIALYAERDNDFEAYNKREDETQAKLRESQAQVERMRAVVDAARELRMYCLGSDCSTRNMVERFDAAINQALAEIGDI